MHGTTSKRGNAPTQAKNKKWVKLSLQGGKLVLGLSALLLAWKFFPWTQPQEMKVSPFSDPNEFVPSSESSLIPGLPKNRIPEYSVDQFHYSAIQNGQKQWKIDAEKAFFYQSNQVVHSLKIKAILFSPDGEETLVEGLESEYHPEQKILHIYGKVKTKFPDGFELYSEYLRYEPKARRIFIPEQYRSLGKGSGSPSFTFESDGLDYCMATSKIVLPKKVTFTLKQSQNDFTEIKSDCCHIDRKAQLAVFSMTPKRFVEITQPSLFVKSRKAELYYGSMSHLFHLLTAHEDVLIIEKGVEKGPLSEKKPLRYATAGKAEFNNQTHIITLTQLPQAYQDQDTVTGDAIYLHRETDVIEVDQGNAYSEGSS